MLTKYQIESAQAISLAKFSKIDYATKGAALDDVKLIHIQQKFHSKKYASVKKAGRKLKPYLCNRCGLWHLTSNVNYGKALKRIKK